MKVDIYLGDKPQSLHSRNGKIIVIYHAADEIDDVLSVFRQLYGDMRTCCGKDNMLIRNDRGKCKRSCSRIYENRAVRLYESESRESDARLFLGTFVQALSEFVLHR